MSDKTELTSTSQAFLDIHDITNNFVIQQSGTTSLIITVSAMNFGLLSEQEQDAVIYAYARLLNSLNYPIQILIQSQTKDASTYLKKLEAREAETTDKLKKAWIRRYSQFVSDLIQQRNVLDKKFFVIIPATALEMGLETVSSVIPGSNKFNVENIEKSVILEKAKNLLEPKRDHLISQFGALGLYARQLDTQEIIRLFYTNYNPEASEGQQITDSQSYTTPMVQARFQGGLMNAQAKPVTTTPADQTQAEPQAPVAPTATPAQPAMPEPTKPVEPVAPVQPAPQAPVAPVADQPSKIAESPQLKIPAEEVLAPAQPDSQAPSTPTGPTVPVQPAAGEVPITTPTQAPTMPQPTAPAQPAMPVPTKPVEPTAPAEPQIPEAPTMPAASVDETQTQEEIDSALKNLGDQAK